jgi:PPOX class probable F420-dependent enzyme
MTTLTPQAATVAPGIDRAAAMTPGLDLARAGFIDLVTFRRSGAPVGTPVLFVQDGDRLLIRTAHDTGKLKRLAHTTRVEVSPADQRGRHVGSTRTGTARILGPEAVAPMLAALHAKHRLAGPVSTFVRHLRRQRDVIVEVVLDTVQ